MTEIQGDLKAPGNPCPHACGRAPRRAAGHSASTPSQIGVALSSATGSVFPGAGQRGRRGLKPSRYEEGKGGLCSDLLFLNFLAPDGKLKAGR